MTLHDTPLSEAPLAPRPRDLAAAVLRAASRSLDRLAVRLAAVEDQPLADAEFEFHAEAGAPEGAVYVNGRLAGYLPGVTRL
jgi:hypothetical protein